MSPWQARGVPFKFQLSDWTSFQNNECGLRYAPFVRSHTLRDRFSAWAGALLNGDSVKAKARRLIRKHG